jgi:hypothetical protein
VLRTHASHSACKCCFLVESEARRNDRRHGDPRAPAAAALCGRRCTAERLPGAAPWPESAAAPEPHAAPSQQLLLRRGRRAPPRRKRRQQRQAGTAPAAAVRSGGCKGDARSPSGHDAPDVSVPVCTKLPSLRAQAQLRNDSAAHWYARVSTFTSKGTRQSLQAPPEDGSRRYGALPPATTALDSTCSGVDVLVASAHRMRQSDRTSRCTDQEIAFGSLQRERNDHAAAGPRAFRRSCQLGALLC